MPPVTEGPIRHAVAFRLSHPEGSEAEADFLAAVAELESIDGVEDFRLMDEVSPKNGFRFWLEMRFADQAAYDAYNEHPAHTRFVESRWVPEVADFLEIDTVAR
jgi:quinol monooxygenase YgiN